MQMLSNLKKMYLNRDLSLMRQISYYQYVCRSFSRTNDTLLKKHQTTLKLMYYFQVSQLSQSNANIRNFLKSNKNLRTMFFKFHTMLVKFKAKGLSI